MTRTSLIVLPVICLAAGVCVAQAPETAPAQTPQQHLRMVLPAEVYAVPGVDMNVLRSRLAAR
ncbi:MAG: hypothetical protein U9R79_11915 [Armatimonadota bacterium]|nr:hypothetical protein [Armatimonadota bacterium]